MRRKATLIARGQDEEKVGISLKIPKSLKERLQDYSEQQSVSMNALISAFIELGLDDDYEQLLQGIYAELKSEALSLEHDIYSCQHDLLHDMDPDDANRLRNIEDAHSKVLNLANSLKRYI
ncbi:hypothetical protein LOH54_02430 [Sulfurimonas sp. HSL-3221]|uniref:hypothetical protein n=1 Tax=Sulfurimonadaceae TaxID=2771471 RepID=UPI001E3343C5|nr:hypothetical protein [Sulfurimonas sp. HSL-3221]UFS62991.1 hypothetical protein LOH54_02430 [Sulfurimonas sp. HSL-3221]